MINCRHASASDHVRAVRCAIADQTGYGQHPSIGTCRQCKLRDPWPGGPPHPIPDDYDIDAERLRAQQGGCCNTADDTSSAT